METNSHSDEDCNEDGELSNALLNTAMRVRKSKQKHRMEDSDEHDGEYVSNFKMEWV